MAEVNISINGRIHEISCDSGQEGRVVDLASYIDQRLQQIARSGAAYNDAHLLVLTALVIADELFETREKLSAVSAAPVAAPAGKARKGEEAAAPAANPEEEKAMAQLIEKLAKRIDGIAARVQAA
ncbi:MAG TPA: cell division protein ZapA [Alphaproteobacteria bacterium]|nr:cell division protein ZapA [Rhodospirillaceae bacterium]HRJ66769.1 cell division protein ZapA [Alphaproteobacteria bacterium]